MKCQHCGDEVPDHGHDEHPEWCCDCYDLSWGMPLDQLNDERAAKGKPPLPPLKGRT